MRFLDEEHKEKFDEFCSRMKHLDEYHNEQNRHTQDREYREQYFSKHSTTFFLSFLPTCLRLMPLPSVHVGEVHVAVPVVRRKEVLAGPQVVRNASLLLLFARRGERIGCKPFLAVKLPRV